MGPSHPGGQGIFTKQIRAIISASTWYFGRRDLLLPGPLHPATATGAVWGSFQAPTVFPILLRPRRGLIAEELVEGSLRLSHIMEMAAEEIGEAEGYGLRLDALAPILESPTRYALAMGEESSVDGVAEGNAVVVLKRSSGVFSSPILVVPRGHCKERRGRYEGPGSSSKSSHGSRSARRAYAYRKAKAKAKEAHYSLPSFNNGDHECDIPDNPGSSAGFREEGSGEPRHFSYATAVGPSGVQRWHFWQSLCIHLPGLSGTMNLGGRLGPLALQSAAPSELQELEKENRTLPRP